MNLRPSLPLSLECWNSTTLPRTQYNHVGQDVFYFRGSPAVALHVYKHFSVDKAPGFIAGEVVIFSCIVVIAGAGWVSLNTMLP